LHKRSKNINGYKCTASQNFRDAGKRIGGGADCLLFITAFKSVEPPKRAIPPQKKISFTNALRLITQFCLTGKDVSSITGLRAEIEKLLTKILKHPKHKPDRHYPRKTKKGKYQKYA
jgi:hypothetical protein